MFWAYKLTTNFLYKTNYIYYRYRIPRFHMATINPAY